MPQPRKLHDQYFRKAKAEGYVARSAYKLIEIQEKHRLMRRGDYVLDCGCAPGSWLQVVEKLIGHDGLALGIDLQETRAELGKTVHTLQGDVFAFDPTPFLERMGRHFDCLLSDMAPNTSGHGDDHLSARLCRKVLELAPHVLATGGSLCMKILEGSDFPEVLNETRAVFDEAGAMKPHSSREVSRETFIWGLGYRGERSVGPLPAPVAPRPERSWS